MTPIDRKQFEVRTVINKIDSSTVYYTMLLCVCVCMCVSVEREELWVERKLQYDIWQRSHSQEPNCVCYHVVNMCLNLLIEYFYYAILYYNT